MLKKAIHKTLTYCIASVWLINGLFCKILNFVPRHQQIIARILGSEHARTFTLFIGLLETAMAIWILSNIKTRLNAIAQIIIIATMNTLEFFLVPGLLLWGKYNAVFASLLIIAVYYNEFYLNKKPAQQT